MEATATTQNQIAEDDINHGVFIYARLYKMLINGDTEAIELEISSNPSLSFSDLIWELDNSSALHIAAGAGQLSLVDYIFNRDRHLLRKPNSEGDLPIHVAVRAGHEVVVDRLVELGGDNHLCIIESENNEKNTPLHIALEYRRERMAQLLFQQSQRSFYQLNAQGICPLYLAIKAGFWGLVSDMIAAEVGNPHLVARALEGTRSSVVHAAIMARKQEQVVSLISKYPDLVWSLDKLGRTPCSYAAYIGFLDGVRYFLDEFPEEAFQRNEDGSFPIHEACKGGHIEVVKELSTRFPNTKRLRNKKGQNILHIASSNGKGEIVEYLLRQNGLEVLINEKDKDGNTPLHLASMRKHAKVVYAFTRDHRVMMMLQNKQGLTPLDLAEDYGDLPSIEERLTWLALTYANAPRSSHTMRPNEVTPLPKRHKYKEKLSTLLMVSTLIATVTFAAAFTIPGGYGSSDERTIQEGMAILARRRAFQVFVLSNMAALYSSIFAATTLIWAHLDDRKLSLTSLDIALPSLTVALGMMSIAFMTGLFVVLHGVCGWLATVVFIMSCAFLPWVLVVLVPLYFPSPSTKNIFARAIFHVTFSFLLLVCDRETTTNNLE